MKNYFIVMCIVVFSSISNASLNREGDIVDDIVNVSCSEKRGEMAFALNLSTKTITFSDTSFFGQANLPLNRALGVQVADMQRNSKIQFQYDWYFSATYELYLTKALSSLKPGSRFVAVLNGDDRDGSIFNDVQLDCSIK